MKRNYIGLAMAALVALGASLSLPSCGHSQKLVSLVVGPATASYSSPQAGEVLFSATGTYIHPPETKIITDQVTWSTDVPELLLLNYKGVAGAVAPSGGNNCGVADILATAPEGTGGSGNVVLGYATVTVNDPTQVNCPGYGTEVELSVQVTGNGTVTSTTGSISCPTLCITPVAVGQSVGLTAFPQTGYVVNWLSGCTSFSVNDCSITVPAGGVNVLASFTAQP
jgi:hypothetical protein